MGKDRSAVAEEREGLRLLLVIVFTILMAALAMAVLADALITW